MALDLKAIAALATRIGLGIAGNTRKTCVVTFGPMTGQTFNAATDVMTADPGRQNATVLALKFAKQVEKQPKVKLSDGTMALYSHTYGIAAADLPVGAELNEQTTILEGGTNWITILAKRDPGEALWLVDVRR